MEEEENGSGSSTGDTSENAEQPPEIPEDIMQFFSRTHLKTISCGTTIIIGDSIVKWAVVEDPEEKEFNILLEIGIPVLTAYLLLKALAKKFTDAKDVVKSSSVESELHMYTSVYSIANSALQIMFSKYHMRFENIEFRMTAAKPHFPNHGLGLNTEVRLPLHAAHMLFGKQEHAWHPNTVSGNETEESGNDLPINDLDNLALNTEEESGCKTNINNLPEEVLLIIFEMLDANAVFAAGNTCQEWQNMIFAKKRLFEKYTSILGHCTVGILGGVMSEIF